MNLTQFESLIKSVQRFGVEIKPFTPIPKDLSTTGISVDLNSVFKTEEGLISIFEGRVVKIIVHISDISNYRRQDNDPRFHIFQCETLNDMKKKKRGYRYKISTRSDGEFFLVKKDKSFLKKLEICSNCLVIHNDRFKQRKTKKTFEVKKYLAKPIHRSNINITDELDICTIPQEYASDWRGISKKIKEDADYRCSKCYEDFSASSLRRFLHTHHIDANKNHNSRENLKALCIKCHSEEYNHGHLKSHRDYKEYLRIKGRGF